MGAGGTVTVGEREREAVASGAQANFADQEAGAGATDGVLRFSVKLEGC